MSSLKIRHVLASQLFFSLAFQAIPGATSIAHAAAAGSSAPSEQVQANTGMPPATQAMLIDKLTMVNLNLAVTDGSKNAILLRLADLHAERARQASNLELKNGCDVCSAGQADREKALKYYLEAFDRAPKTNQARVLLQVGHLQEMLKDTDAARVTYEKVIASGSVSDLELAEAQLLLGEMLFKQRQFEVANKYFEAVLKSPESAGKGLAAFRSAWCLFNSRQMDAATARTQEILTDKNLQSRSGNIGAVGDTQFLEEVSRDYATFLAQRGVRPDDLAMVAKLSPARVALENIYFLALESERLGQRAPAIHVWQYVHDNDKRPSRRGLALAHLAILSFDVSQSEVSAKSFRSGLDLAYQGSTCDEECAEARKLLRTFVVQWNKIEKLAPSSGLLEAYAAFLKYATDDVEMHLWAAQVAAERAEPKRANAWLTQVVQLQMAKYESATSNSARDADLEKQIEKTLLTAVENGERSKDGALLAAAQNQYLKYSISQSSKLSVQYQLAKAEYDAGLYQEAATHFHGLALEPAGDASVKKQAADLALDTLVLLKDEARLTVWSAEFATAFPTSKTEFQSVGFRAQLTQAAQIAKADPKKALEILVSIPLSQLSDADRTTALKNKVMLYEGQKQYPAARAAVEDLLSEKTLSSEVREFAMTRKLWLAEVDLDFKEALKIADQMRFREIPEDQRLLKLALYADLAEQDPRRYYQKYLQVSSNEEKKRIILMESVKLSQNAAKDLAAAKAKLRLAPEVLAQLYVDLYTKDKNPKWIESLALEKDLKKTAAWRAADQWQAMNRLDDASRKVAAHHIDGSKQKILETSLRARLKLMKTLDDAATTSLATEEWSVQIAALEVVKTEYMRFYQELLSLPVPEGLSPEDEQAYMNALGQQAAPHMAKSQQAEAKLNELLANSKAVPEMKTSLQTLTIPFYREVTARQLKTLLPIVKDDLRASVEDALTYQNQITVAIVEPKAIEDVRNNLRQDPLNPDVIRKALDIEKLAGKTSRVQYLAARLTSVENPTASEVVK